MAAIRQLVVYYRTRPLEPGFSDQALQEQRAAVAHWLTDNPASVFAEYYEQEIDGMLRPRLAEALAKCKATKSPVGEHCERTYSSQPLVLKT